MSKERLEELEDLFEDISNDMMPPYVGITLDTVVDVKWVIKYAKEQAERVQELERVNKQLKGNLSVYKGYYKNMMKINDVIVEENKKYRKGIDKIMECVNEHLSDGTEINPYKIDDIVDDIEDDSENEVS